jgi:MFS family permease
MAGAIVAPVLPVLRRNFSSTPNADLLVTLVLTLPALVIALAAPVMGFLADKFGRTRLLVVSLIAFVVSGVSGFFAQSLQTILVGRIGIGLAVAAIMTTASALLIDHSQDASQQRLVGYQAAAAGLSGVLFPFIAGMLAEFGWRLPFLAYVLPAVLVPLTIYYVQDVPKLGLPARSLAAFPFKKAAMIYALAFVWMIVMYGIPLQISYKLQTIGCGSPTVLGFAIGLPSLAAATTSFNFGVVRSRLSPEALVSLAFGSMGCGYAIVAGASTLPFVMIGLAIAGIGFGLSMPNLLSWLQAEMPLFLRGRAAGAYTTATFLGQFSATFVYSALQSAVSPVTSFGVIGAACCGLVALWIIVMPQGDGAQKPTIRSRDQAAPAR